MILNVSTRRPGAQPHDNGTKDDGPLTKLQQLAYDAQLAAGLPASLLAVELLHATNGEVSAEDCANYLVAVQQTVWFTAAFPSHINPLRVTGGRGLSSADASARTVKIGARDRLSIVECEQACLHELAHVVSSDYGPDGERREPQLGRYSSKGHHHAWRANFVFLVRMVIGKRAAAQLRREFNQWGLATSK